MPQKTLLGVTRGEWLEPVNWGGLSTYCTGYANHDGYTVYVSLIGRVVAVKAVWAAFIDHQPLELPDRTILRRWPSADETKYHTVSVRLPESDWGHTVIVYSQATQRNLSDQIFYVLSGEPQPLLRSFWEQWNHALAYPAQLDWAAYLWQQGVQHQLVTECQSQGTYCWAVKPDETWAEIISKGIQSGEIKS